MIISGRIAIAAVHSRRHGLVNAPGAGVGAAVFSLVAMLGQKLLFMIPELFMVLKVAGGAYLLWLAVKMFRDSIRPLNLRLDGDNNDMTLMIPFRNGLLTQLSNPVTAIFIAGYVRKKTDYEPFPGSLLGSWNFQALAGRRWKSSTSVRAYALNLSVIKYRREMVTDALPLHDLIRLKSNCKELMS
ncbi:TPA: LysE family transporter [Enterobacter cloacae subsp. dissolvens]|nr:LysE family transporter [Enterobacter cloacae subsp. dissolvens]